MKTNPDYRKKTGSKILAVIIAAMLCMTIPVFAYADDNSGVQTENIQQEPVPENILTEPADEQTDPVQTDEAVPDAEKTETPGIIPEPPAMILGTEPPVPDYLSLTASGNVTVGFSNVNSYGIEFSKDNTAEIWEQATTATSISLADGESVYFRTAAENPVSSNTDFTRFSTSGEGTLSAGGNAMSLIDRNCTSTSINGNSLCYLFDGCTNLREVSDTLLPSTVLAEACYRNMFYGCTNLVNAPELPAKNLAPSCYHNMFAGCTGLTEFPSLPARTLPESCYNSMFYGCTGLTAVPQLPINTIGKESCAYMFAGCTGLSSSLNILKSIETVGDYGCQNMFQNCTGLRNASLLPAKNIGISCYFQMFDGCTELTSAPSRLPATTLSAGCYMRMYRNTKIKSAPILDGTTLCDSCCKEMFAGCSKLEKTPKLNAKTLAESCYEGMFKDCVSLTTPAELPAETLAKKCYCNMFLGCTGIKLTEEKTAYPYNVTKNVTEDPDKYRDWGKEMFDKTGGSFTGTPEAGRTYYLDLPVPDYLCLTASGNVNIGFKTINSGGVEYTKDLTETEWMNAEADTLIQLNNGESVYFRAKPTVASFWYDDYTQFEMSGSGLVSATGKAMFLVYRNYADNGVQPCKEACFYRLFSGCENLSDVSETLLPATLLANSCYEEMFSGCRKLINTPILPAGTMKPSCYRCMFSECTSLTEPADLPATKLANACYEKMFAGCTGIKITTTETAIKYRLPSMSDPNAKIENAASYTNWNNGMFDGTGGNFTGNPEANRIYYIALGRITPADPDPEKIAGSPQTGDETDLGICTVLAVISAAVIVFAVFRKKVS